MACPAICRVVAVTTLASARRAWERGLSRDLLRSGSKIGQCAVSGMRRSQVLLPVPGSSRGKPAPAGLGPESKASGQPKNNRYAGWLLSSHSLLPEGRGSVACPAICCEAAVKSANALCQACAVLRFYCRCRQLARQARSCGPAARIRSNRVSPKTTDMPGCCSHPNTDNRSPPAPAAPDAVHLPAPPGLRPRGHRRRRGCGSGTSRYSTCRPAC